MTTDNFLVVKIGRSRQQRVTKRLYNIYNTFSGDYGASIFKTPPQQGAKIDTIIKRTKSNLDNELFLLSKIVGTKKDSDFAEREAREMIGDKQLIFDPTLKASKETEWVLVPRSVVDNIRRAQRNGKMDHFDNAKDFIEKLRNCTDKRYMKVDVSLGQTRASVCIPKYNTRKR